MLRTTFAIAATLLLASACNPGPEELEQQIRATFERDGMVVESIDLAPNAQGHIEGEMRARVGGVTIIFDCTTAPLPEDDAMAGMQTDYRCERRE